jgi:ornithine carbamoyltransferase
VVGANDLQLGRGESIEDTAKIVSSFARAFVIRTFSDEDVRRFSAAATIPVVNALTDGHHPCQSVADVFTLRERFGSLEGLRLAYLGDGNNVAHSLMEAAALSGIDFVLAGPPGYEPAVEVVERAREIGSSTRGRVTLTHDPVEAVTGAQAVYTDVWLSMGVPEAERTTRLEAFAPYQVDELMMSRAAPEAVFLHCLPAHRGEEVTGEVIDGPQSIVFAQAANRGPTELAILYALLSDPT